jgi:hypothetical protein
MVEAVMDSLDVVFWVLVPRTQDFDSVNVKYEFIDPPT